MSSRNHRRSCVGIPYGNRERLRPCCLGLRRGLELEVLGRGPSVPTVPKMRGARGLHGRKRKAWGAEEGEAGEGRAGEGAGSGNHTSLRRPPGHISGNPAIESFSSNVKPQKSMDKVFCTKC